MKAHLGLLIIILPLLVRAQDEPAGIKWTEGLTFEQVKQKAKEGGKYIFIDAFATWCAPCKKMDKEVYTNDSVGNLFNDKFISVKVQMDKTKIDGPSVQSWYNDAVALNKQYKIEGYPSFLFFSPQGTLVHKEIGYKTVKELVSMAQAAMLPDKVYEDPYAEYDRLVADYNQGKKNYDRMIYMSKVALKLNDEVFAKQLLNEHSEYCLTLEPKKRYTREAVEYWASFMASSKRPRFWFFYRDSEIIDELMDKKGYANAIVDRTIQHELVDSFFRAQPGGAVMASGMKLVEPGKKAVPDNTEADWDNLYKIIKDEYKASYAKRNVLEARLRWYDMHDNFRSYAEYYLGKIEKDPPDFSDEDARVNLDENSWKIFLNVTDKKLLKRLSEWLEKLVKQYSQENPGRLDTYANLLYKLGRRQNAVVWMRRAVDLASGRDLNEAEEFSKILEQMKRGEKTYLNQGAVWE